MAEPTEKIEDGMTFAAVPVLALRGLTAMADSVIHIDVGRQKSIAAVKDAFENDKSIFLVTQKNPMSEDISREGVYDVGTLCKVRQMINTSGDAVRVLIKCGCRAAITGDFHEDGNTLYADVTELKCSDCFESDSIEIAARMRLVRKVFNSLTDRMDNFPREVSDYVATQKDVGALVDYITANIPFDFDRKQQILEETDAAKRLVILLGLLMRETEIVKEEADIISKVHERLTKNQKDAFLREQMRIIKEELGEEDPFTDDGADLWDMFDNAVLPEDCKETISREIHRYFKLPLGSQEAAVSRTYIETCLELPWGKYSKETVDIKKAREILEKEHYGLEKVKDRILETIAVKQKYPEHKGQILCLIGPPGTGKTSIAKSIAKALNRKYVRISLGGINDESEIRGHRRTYIGSMPGKIIAAVNEAKTSNPLILLDEIDKLGNDRRGDPASAMLEVLDPEQNKTFKDHYIDMPFDLSNVFFITTANDASGIPAPLWDRMDVIELSTYTYEEKLQIAKKHLLPKQLKKHGLKASEVKIDKSALDSIIMFYTREAGVRGLEKNIASLCRKATKKILEEDIDSVKITAKNIHEYLGVKKVIQDRIPDSDRIGVVTGLAYTAAGGEIMPLEVNIMDGTGKVELTGSLGDVMKESAVAAISYIRANASELGVSPTFYKDKDIHIHAPEGAVPKDGPSAGCAMATALYSQLASKPIKNDIAMTGEITIRGSALAIGGLKEKTMAAYKAGVKTVILPTQNKPDIEEVADVVKQNVNFVYADNIRDVFKVAFR